MASKARAFQQTCRTRTRTHAYRHTRHDQLQFQRASASSLSSPTTLSSAIVPSNSTQLCPLKSASPTASLRLALYTSHQRPQARRRPANYAAHPHPHARHASSSTNPNSTPSRRAITVTSDDGRYNWSELSRTEKAARGTQQTFNFLLVGLGVAGTATVSYLLYSELFAPSSSTIQFNAAVKRIKASAECRALLGPASKIKAFGEPTSNKWARARPLAHGTEVDRLGTTHFRMHFNVEGPEGAGVVSVHMTRPRDGDRLEYQTLSLSVKGQETVFLENRDAERGVKGKAGKMFGIQWR